MRFTVCESGDPPIRATIEEHYVPWYSNVDSSMEWQQYASGLGSLTLPLIAIIDPDDSGHYLDRTTGVQAPAVFYDRLRQHARIDGACGSANGGTFGTAPATNLCAAGTATAVSGTGPWTWSCMGLNGGTNANCSAGIRTKIGLPWMQLLLAQPVNGACGSANGGMFPTAPTENLCSTGTVSAFIFKLPTGWIWTCTGTDGGTNASCHATWFWL